MTAKTGEKCPVSGVWKVDGFPTTTAPIAKGGQRNNLRDFVFKHII